MTRTDTLMLCDSLYVRLIEPAIQYALSRHRTMSTDPVRISAILGEEAGEVCRAALEMTRADPTGNVARVIEELAQVAAVAILGIAALTVEKED